MIDYSLILATNYSGKDWILIGEDYAGITWNDTSPKPTEDELIALWETTQAQVAQAKQAAETAKQAAEAKLSALGLTPDDLKALLG
jgi:hypothetical protein